MSRGVTVSGLKPATGGMVQNVNSSPLPMAAPVKRLIHRMGELAGEPGLEPRLTESESVVLPLNYSPTATND